MIRLAIDLGSYKTKIYMLDYGIVLSEYTDVGIEYDANDAMIFCCGDEAHSMRGKCGNSRQIISPVSNGHILNKKMVEGLLEYFFEKIGLKRSKLHKIEVLFILPCSFRDDDKKMYDDVANELNIGRVYYTISPFAACASTNFPFTDKSCFACLDIGHSVVNCAVIAGTSTLSGATMLYGSNKIDNKIRDIFQEKGLLIGEYTSEKIKNKLCSLVVGDYSSTQCEGTRIDNSQPQAVKITAEFIAQVVLDYYNQIEEFTRRVLSQLPPEVSSKIAKYGIFITGGGALTKGIKEHFEKKFNFKVTISDHPEYDCVLGASKILAIPDYTQKLTTR